MKIGVRSETLGDVFVKNAGTTILLAFLLIGCGQSETAATDTAVTETVAPTDDANAAAGADSETSTTADNEAEAPSDDGAKGPEKQEK